MKKNSGGKVDAVADEGEADPPTWLYAISVAAEMVGTGVQNLRAYEARGLLTPSRTGGGTRRYSAHDVDRLRRIGDPTPWTQLAPGR